MGLASSQVLGAFGAFRALFLLEEMLINYYLAETKLDQTRLSKLDQARLFTVPHGQSPPHHHPASLP